MIFLLYWVGYAAAVGTAACYAAYKTALVQRTLAVALRRGLRGLMHDIADQSQGCTVVSTGTGVDLLNVLPALLRSEQTVDQLFAVSRCFHGVLPGPQVSGWSMQASQRACSAKLTTFT